MISVTLSTNSGMEWSKERRETRRRAEILLSALWTSVLYGFQHFANMCRTVQQGMKFLYFKKCIYTEL